MIITERSSYPSSVPIMGQTGVGLLNASQESYSSASGSEHLRANALNYFLKHFNDEPSIDSNNLNPNSNVTTPVGNVTELITSQDGESGIRWGMLALILVIICTAVGNLLVCLAVCWEKRLQNMTNYFLMSLAIADFLVSLLVMPLGMVVEMFGGQFPLNPEICVLWVTSDVLMCSASIWHMCTMSMDRFFTLKYPMRYGRNKTRRMVLGKILFVWVVSMAISSPILFFGFLDTANVYNHKTEACVPMMENFIIYGSIFAFYIPLSIMLVTYVLTIRLLWRNQDRMQKMERSDLKPRLAQLTAQCTGLAMPKLLTNLRRPSKSPVSSQTNFSKARSERQPLAPISSQQNIRPTSGNANLQIPEDTQLLPKPDGRRSASPAFLAPPSPQLYTPRTPSPLSMNRSQNFVVSDTDESDCEPNYFSLLQSSQSCRSLSTPLSLACSDQSLHKLVQKKQFCQSNSIRAREANLQLREQKSCPASFQQNNSEFEQSRPMTYLEAENDSQSNHADDLVDHSTPRVNSSTVLKPPPSPSPSPPSSPMFDNPNAKEDFPMCHMTTQNEISVTSPKAVSIKSSSRDNLNKTKSDKPMKRKKYSKRSKKRKPCQQQQQQLQLDQDDDECDNCVEQSCNRNCNNNAPNEEEICQQLLAVPSQMYFRKGRNSKKPSQNKVLSMAISDTQVSQAGRSRVSDDERDQSKSYFHLSYSNLNKDYKSMEWDRRYFQIQQEMDDCLKEDTTKTDSKSLDDQADHSDSEENENTQLLVTPTNYLLKKSSSMPGYASNFPPSKSCSVPNSPIEKRTKNSFSSQGSLTDMDADISDMAGNSHETSDKNEEEYDEDEDNEDTSGSSNPDVITIRLHPPSPVSKNTNLTVKNKTSCVSSISLHDPSKYCNNSESRSMRYNTLGLGNSLTKNNYSKSEGNFVALSNGTSNGQAPHSPISPTDTGLDERKLSSASSNHHEVFVSSEGELTLEETDDTLDDNSRSGNTVIPNTNRYRKRQQSPRPSKSTTWAKPKKRGSFKNSFRSRRNPKKHAKMPVKHFLSKKTASNEKKASKVLGIIFVVFVTLWTPFFTVNIISATCRSCITAEMMSLFLWMGYIASLANPIIYTMFNTAFRRTFIRILTCRINRTCGIKTSDLHYMSYTTMLASERRNTMTVVLRDESR